MTCRSWSRQAAPTWSCATASSSWSTTRLPHWQRWRRRSRAGGRLSLLVANRDAVVLARALAGRPDEAAHVLTDPAGRWGDDRRHRPALDARRPSPTLVAAAGLRVEQVHGVRTVSDLVPSAVLDLEPGAAAALLSLERALADLSPFRELATQLHLLARKQ